MPHHPAETGALRDALAGAVTDAFRSLKGKSENPHALGNYLRGCDCVIEDTDRGVPLSAAIQRNYSDRLAAAINSRMAELGYLDAQPGA